MDGFQIITIFISVGALAVAGFSAYFSHKSAKSAEGSLQHIKTPLLIIEKKSKPYFHIKNVGNGIAKNIKWVSPNRLTVRTDSENFDFLLPNAQTLANSEMNPDGIELKLVIHEENMKIGKKYILNINYEDIENNKRTSKFYLIKNESNEVRHKVKEI